MRPDNAASEALRIIPVGPDAAEAACTVIRQSITHCCALDHGHDPTILMAWLANKTPENLAAMSGIMKVQKAKLREHAVRELKLR